ncbi:periplasmic protein [Legionella gratiana]|uniref:Periplasmic protein n=1 Tax=Legionella gratiana TaxID=45066 RepID=A0A378JNK1_9GAMM|nr:hypothetical protein [Legionella gratiana]KTD12056.1 periplasmic protein [Legionella gratiana]STX46340.1 periplasmic protein [Legionella gratiana]
MLARLFIFILSFIASCSLWAFTCYYTLAKDNCWTKYNVTVQVIDGLTEKVLITPTVPAGKSWVRETFSCSVAQSLMFRAQFSPVFWENDKDKVYVSKRFWPLPGTINPGDSAWNISVCFPADFTQVPLPPEATSNCTCDFDSIPVIPPKKIQP